MTKAFIFSKLAIVLGFLPVNQSLGNCCVFYVTVLTYENIPMNSWRDDLQNRLWIKISGNQCLCFVWWVCFYKYLY